VPIVDGCATLGQCTDTGGSGGTGGSVLKKPDSGTGSRKQRNQKRKDQLAKANLDEEIMGLERGMTPESIFMTIANDPLHNPDGNYNGFGACNTITGSCVQHHPGIDVGPGGEENPNVYSVGNGEVTYIGSMKPGYGIYIIIKHTMYGENFYSVYAHLKENSVAVNVGDRVSSNTLIANMGNTGTDLVHLHFEVRTSLGVNGQGTGFRGSGVHPEQPGDAYWAYSREDLDTYWGNLSQLNWSGGYDSGYATWPKE